MNKGFDTRRAMRTVGRATVFAVSTAIATAFLLMQISDKFFEATRAGYQQRFAGRRIISEYLRVNPVRKLHIGAGGNNMPGWLNTDIEPADGQGYLDASEPFPLADGSLRFIYSEHMIEHISYEQGLAMLKECHRVLESGGKVRIVTPNLKKFIKLFDESRTKDDWTYMRRKIGWHKWPSTSNPEVYILNQEMREWGHRFVYTPELLGERFRQSGFSKIKQFPVGESDEAALANIESRTRWNVNDVNHYESMVLQATK